MRQQQIIIDVQGTTEEELNSAIKKAGAALVSGRALREECDEANFAVRLGSEPSWSPNSLYVIGTDAAGNIIISSTRSSVDARKDQHIMDAALELSQAVEFRGVEFKEHKIGGLLVRPVPKAKPMRDTAQLVELSHISDMANIDDEDVAEFIASLPGVIAAMKLAKQECAAIGIPLSQAMPMLQYVADSADSLSIVSESTNLTITSDTALTAWSQVSPEAPQGDKVNDTPR